MYSTINWSIRANIGYLSLATPPQNAMGIDFYSEFSDLVEIIYNKKELSGLIISGEGRHFSSGANIKQLFSLFSESDSEIPDAILQNSNSFIKLSELEIPVVCTIKGVCLGSAFELALSSHFRIAAPNALLGLPETTFDIMPGLGGIQNMYNCIGKARTLELVLSGESLSAIDGKELGLIDKLEHKSNLFNTAVSLINSIGNNYQKGLKTKYLNDFNSIDKGL